MYTVGQQITVDHGANMDCLADITAVSGSTLTLNVKIGAGRGYIGATYDVVSGDPDTFTQVTPGDYETPLA